MGKVKVGVGLVGCGVMGKSLATHLKTIGQAEFVAACDAVEEVAKSFRSEFGVWTTTSLDELLLREDVDAVLIATPAYSSRRANCCCSGSGQACLL